MTALYFLIPMALILLTIAFYFFFWSLRKGHYEDLESPAHSILIEDREERIRMEARKNLPQKPPTDTVKNDGGSHPPAA